MVAIVEYNWQDIVDGNPLPESLTRKLFREAVEEVSQKAREALPESNGRIDSAVKIVLAGDVELLDEGKAKVASQSNGTTKYFLVNGSCECRDFEKAPANFCKHRLAYGIAKRANTLAKERLEAQLDSQRPAPTPEIAAPVSLPEAPASCNCYVEVAGRKVQITLRDADETRLLTRLESLLTRFPAEEPESTTPSEGWCSIHQVQMNHSKDGKGYYHKAGEKPGGKAIWCRGK
jgi:hypothetical protein